MKILVNDGTTKGNADLCYSCSHLKRFKTTIGNTRSHCALLGWIPKIAECNVYNPRKQPHGLFYEQSWQYNRDVTTGVEHFYHPQDRSWSIRKIEPKPVVLTVTPPPKITWKRKLRSKAHSILDKILSPITKCRDV